MGEVSQVFIDAPKFIRQLQNSPTTQKSIRAQGRSQTRGWLVDPKASPSSLRDLTFSER
jgi:hypothetical protein